MLVTLKRRKIDGIIVDIGVLAEETEKYQC
jgi:hypothetical protein